MASVSSVESIIEEGLRQYEKSVQESIQMDIAWRAGYQVLDKWLDKKYAEVLGDLNVDSSSGGTGPDPAPQ